MAWVCDNCYSEMDVSRDGRNRKKISCPQCGTYWYVDNDDEYINDGSDWSPNDENDDDEE